MDLENIYQKIKDDDEGKFDQNVIVGDLEYPTPHLVTSDGEPVPQLLYDGSTYDFTNWSYTQFCSKLGVPASYMLRCPPWLNKSNTDYWLGEHMEDEWFMRCKGREYPAVRAVLSPKYLPINNADVFEMLAENTDFCNLTFKNFWLPDKKMGMRAIINDGNVMVDGHPIYSGIDIYNSEVGAYTFCAYASLFVEICSNGMIAMKYHQNLFRKVHKGNDNYMNIGTEFGGVLKEAVATCAGMLETVKKSADTTRDIDRIVEVGLAQGIGQRYLDSISEEFKGDNARVYDFVSEITRRAQELPVETRHEIEGQAMAMTERLVA